jgi:sugar transferase (PEP-CTERM/EpsH1 system associated)
MRILMISHFVPFPPNTGALQRNFNLLREIALSHEVHLVTLTQKALLPDKARLDEAISRVSQYCKTIRVFPIPSDKSPFRWYSMLLINLLSGLPYSVKRFFSSAMNNEVGKIIRESAIDVIHVDTIDLAQYVSSITGIPMVLNHHNVESDLLRRRAHNASNPLVKWYAHMQAGRLSAYEKRMMPLFHDNLAVSTIDKTVLERMCPRARLSVVPNGTDTEFFTPSDRKQEYTLIFAGGLNWYPNKDAMIHFCTCILPTIVKECPQVRMQIIGQDPPKELAGFSSQKLPVDVLGFVPDVREYFAAAAMQVVPLRVGGGTRLKILDALAMGKAVVSTSIGEEGLELVNGRDLLIADTDDDFAKKVIMLINNKELRRTLGRNGRATVEQKYSWKVITPLLIDSYESAIKRLRGTSNVE